MSEQQPITWKTAKARPRSRSKDLRHTSTVLGLNVEVSEYGILHQAYWRVEGYLGGISVVGADYSGQALDAAKEAAVVAAHRLHAAGMRGEKTDPASEGGEEER